MSDSMRRQALAGDALGGDLDRVVDDGADDASPAITAGLGDVFDHLWHFLISMRLGLVLILLLTFLALVGTLLTQLPAGIQGDQAATAQWLDSVRPKYGGWTDVFNAIGFFNVFSSIWFKVTIVLLTTSLLACSINRTPRLWRIATAPRINASPAFLAHARLRGEVSTPAPIEASVMALRDAFGRQHFRMLQGEDGRTVTVYADRFRWGPFGTVIAHVALVVILAGGVVGTTGFRLTDFAISVGSTVDVGNGTNLAVKADSFTDSYYDNGTPADYASDLVIYQGGQQVAAKTIRVNDPLRVGDVTFFQSFYGPAADIKVTDASGALVAQEGVPLLWASNDSQKAIGQLSLASKGLTIYVVGVASGKVDRQIRPGQVQIEAYADGGSSTPVGVQLVDQGKTAAIAGLQFTFERERQFTGLIVSRDPGAPLVWGGIVLLTLGTILVFLFPHRRIWARVSADATGTGSRVQVAAASRHDITFESSFDDLVNNLRLALPASGS